MHKVNVMWLGLQWRRGWYRVRREDGHPISIWRAMFGQFPRFGSYERDEPGCPDWAKLEYDLVVDSKEV